MSKYIDVSIFCNEYEKELALLKLHLEYDYIDEFIWVENEYNYRGYKKGKILQQMIDGDSRFDKYKDKITIITISNDFTSGNKEIEKTLDPIQYHIAEAELRNAPKQYLLDKYQDNDRVLITDIDEMFDFTNEKRRDRIFSNLNKEVPLQFNRIRYHYDFDIRAFREDNDMICPSYKVEHIRHNQAKLCNKKWVGDIVSNLNNPVAFEYCCCFSYDGILSKFNSSLHTQWVKSKIDDAISTCTIPQTSYQQLSKQNRYQWLKRVPLTEHNSPTYVREHFDELKTGLVPTNYIENRLRLYGFDGIFPENVE